MNRKPGTSGNFTEAWLGSAMDRASIAKRDSPTTYVRKGLPPIMIIHGTADTVVPFDQATKLKKTLDAAGTPLIDRRKYRAVAEGTWLSRLRRNVQREDTRKSEGRFAFMNRSRVSRRR